MGVMESSKFPELGVIDLLKRGAACSHHAACTLTCFGCEAEYPPCTTLDVLCFRTGESLKGNGTEMFAAQVNY